MSRRDYVDLVRERDRFAIEEGEEAYCARMHGEEGEPDLEADDAWVEGYGLELDDPNRYRHDDPYDNPPLDELERRGHPSFNGWNAP